MIRFYDLIQFLKTESRKLYIQTHNFPDPDALAGAFGIQQLLKQFDVPSSIIYEGDIERFFLKNMIEQLDINIAHHSQYSIGAEDFLIIVDGCKGNNNVKLLPGKEVAVVDHHETSKSDDVAFLDIRPDYGSSSSIVYSYFRELNILPSKNVATALLIGIKTDTASLTRKVHSADITAFAELYPLSDMKLANFILRNNIELKDLKLFHYATENIRVRGDFAFCYFPDGAEPNLMGIMGDFFLGINSVHFVVLCARNQNRVNFSVRNERPGINASQIIQDALKDVGFAGGHVDMAGGIIPHMEDDNIEVIYKRFCELLSV